MMIDFTNDTNGGGGSASTALLSYPTGGEALSDTTLYNYIKDLYDNGISATDNATNLTTTGTSTITGAGLITSKSQYATIYGTLPALSVTPTKFSVKGSVEIKNSIGEFNIFTLTNLNQATADSTGILNDSIVLGTHSVSEHPNSLLLYYRTGTHTRTFAWSSSGNIVDIDTKYYFSLDVDGANIKVNWGTSEDNLSEVISINDYSGTTYSYMWLATDTYSTTDTGYKEFVIDLADYEIMINDVFYYAPFYYQITYKKVRTGSKVADVAYDTIIGNLANAQGYALYYTIDTTNKTVKLPRGDIFGFITTALSN